MRARTRALSARFACEDRDALVLVAAQSGTVTVVDTDGPFLLVRGIGTPPF
ncbi:hypothetical protein [Kitasatospora sp. NPDC007106]|uniref:hypothetical protein n=1 Tax=Kitasatospora sp. NPDC007106 TaxID=3156914 RepID=UPI0033DC762E